MTEREAWLQLAEWFDNEARYWSWSPWSIALVRIPGEPTGVRGLCAALMCIDVSTVLADEMDRKIRRALNAEPEERHYLFPLTPEGHHQRAEWCRARAKELET